VLEEEILARVPATDDASILPRLTQPFPLCEGCRSASDSVLLYFPAGRIGASTRTGTVLICGADVVGDINAADMEKEVQGKNLQGLKQPVPNAPNDYTVPADRPGPFISVTDIETSSR